MTDKEIMQQALEVLYDSVSDNKKWIEKRERATAALRSRLEQPEDEPVAQWQKRHIDEDAGKWQNTDEGDAKWWRDNSQGWKIRSLYAAPQPVIAPEWVMLTDDEIFEVIKASKNTEDCFMLPFEFSIEIQAAFIAKQGVKA
jgi:hypothetical protein